MCMFFKELSQLLTSDTGVSLTVYSQNGKLTVSVFPRVKGLKDEAQNHLHPIVLTGTAEELDTGFFDAVVQPVQKATTLLADMKDFEKSLARVEAVRKEVLEEKKNADKRAQERKVKFDKLIERADTCENEGKNNDALKSLRDARTLADGDNVAITDKRIEQVKTKCFQNSLFFNS